MAWTPKAPGLSALSFVNSPTPVKPFFVLSINPVPSYFRSSIVSCSWPRVVRLCTSATSERTLEPCLTTLRTMEPDTATTQRTRQNSCSRLSTPDLPDRDLTGMKSGRTAKRQRASRLRLMSCTSSQATEPENMNPPRKSSANLLCLLLPKFRSLPRESSSSTGVCLPTSWRSGHWVPLLVCSLAFPSTRPTLPHKDYRTSSSRPSWFVQSSLLWFNRYVKSSELRLTGSY